MRVVAIDGPVGSGKSTVARAVADRLGLDCLNTGAMYRAVALVVLRRGDGAYHETQPEPDDPNPDDPNPDGVVPADVVEVAKDIEIDLTGDRVVVDREDVTDEIRSPRVGRLVSAVAAVPEVRAELVALQRRWVEERGGAVVEGRDIGSVVFPDADLKVFLTASVTERARRRELDETADDLARRDLQDSTRAVSPLIVPQGAVVVDTTSRPIDEVVDEIVGMLRE